MPKLAFHWKILIGMVLGVVIGLIAAQISWGPEVVRDWISPFGKMFINLLKLIAVPLVIVSLSKGVSDLKDMASLSRIGGRTVVLYLFTTVVAVIIGLFLVNLFAPGSQVSEETLTELSKDYTSVVTTKLEAAGESKEKGPLDFFVNLVPQNIVEAAGNNGKMLQIIFFVVLFAVCLLLLPVDKQKPLKELFDTVNDVMLKMVDVIMLVAPYAVFALIASLVVETTNAELFKALLSYGGVMLLGMASLLGFYVILVRFFAGRSPGFYLRGIIPAQLVAFSTSSSMATLPVTMEVVEENLGVEKEIASFVCPVGATVNMDATSLMQGIAAVFACQVMGIELGLMDQLAIVLTATLASIGTAAAPSAGIIMLVIVLESVGFPAERLPIALAMILSVDRPLDMVRTIINVSGDTCVSMLVAKSLGKLKSVEEVKKEYI
ncbi:MAG: dicarboxylate/amino acid:cation symporter [Bacteroidota bacterium]